MKVNHFSGALLTVTLSVGVAGTACSSSPATTDEAVVSADSTSTSGTNYTPWRVQRVARQIAADGYLIANYDEFKSFKNAPLGNTGIPMVMFRLFPELFPDIWGAPADNFAPVGFAKDNYEPTRVLPLGLGFSGATPAVPTPLGDVNVNVVNLTCMGCHGGRVQGADGHVHSIVGAPNTQFDGFRGAIGRTVNDPRYTADAFRAALAAKPLGWLYNDPTLLKQESLERVIFGTPGAAEQMMGQLKAGSNFFTQRFIATLGSYTYQVPNAPDPSGHTPGYLDAIGAGITIITDPTVLTPEQVKAALPPAPAMIDIMSVWGQNGRPAAQWDGSIVNALHRNLAAEFGVVGDPSHLNMDNANKTTLLTAKLPAPPYPFDVDYDSSQRGKKLYGQYCASCHTAGNATIFPIATVGTDGNRASIWTPYSIGGLRQVLKASCTDPVTCKNPDGTDVPDDQIVRPTGGYMAIALDGIWSRAPYLHNGSVPSLAALLTKDRPTTFYRGNITYDETTVGFTWDKATSKNAAIFDTTKSGNSNTGHSSAQFLGDIDWKKNPGKLADLLAYMKTL